MEEGYEIVIFMINSDICKKWRKLVIDENGNEIVLCCDEDDSIFGIFDSIFK